jgi:peptidoglycan/LPS O-acetylase OafA/YrhL
LNYSTPSQSRYRPDVDGLRALAVLSVFLFHLRPSFLPGGFLGVDVFFVISGYLITGIILRESHRKTFSFSHFYARRVKRIFPALFVVLLLSSLIATFLLTPETYVNYMKSARYASAQLSNLFFMQNVDYFEEGFSGQPLLHTWSLGVEEQFYLVWPLLIYLCFRFAHPLLASGVTSAQAPENVQDSAHALFEVDNVNVGRAHAGNMAMGLVLILLFLASYALCFVTAETNVNFAFYMFFTRAFEFCIGGWLALGITRQPLKKTSHNLAGIVGFTLMAVSFLVVQQEFVAGSFLRYGTLITCLGTALIIYSSASKSIVNKALAKWLPVSIGKISYSLYLYHWPIIIFWKQYNDVDRLSLSASLIIIAISFGLSILSYKFVEQPARKSSLPDRMVLSIALAAIIVFAVSFRILEDQEVASWRITQYGNSQISEPDFSPECPRRFEKGAGVFNCFPEKISSRPVIALVGDSHSGHYFCSIYQWAERNGYVFKYIGVPGCPMLLGDASIKSWINEENTKQCESGLRAFEKGIVEDPKVELVLIAQRFDLLYDGKGYLNSSRQILFKADDGGIIEDHTQYYREQLLNTVETLRDQGKEVMLLGQVPLFRSVEACNWQPRIKELFSKERVCSFDREFIDTWQQPSLSFIKEFAAEYQVMYFDPFPYLDQPLKNDFNIYKNVDHLNDAGCLYLAPYIFEALDRFITDRKNTEK